MERRAFGCSRRLSVPQVPYPSHAVLSSRVHPAAVLVEAHRRYVLADAVVVDHRVGVVGVQVVQADVLIALKEQIQQEKLQDFPHFGSEQVQTSVIIRFKQQTNADSA